MLFETQQFDMQDVDSVLVLMQVNLIRLHHLSRLHHPPPPAADFSWGGARTSQPGAALTSLRDIQSQEAAVAQRPGITAADLPMLGLVFIIRL